VPRKLLHAFWCARTRRNDWDQGLLVLAGSNSYNI
jgi:hypothetical protein